MAFNSGSSQDEEAPLLANAEENNVSLKAPHEDHGSAPEYVLPIALLAALAMASTAATSFYAYATLLCGDPANCKGNEKSRFAGTVAVTSSIANILSMLALGHLQKLCKTNHKAGLLIWLLTRSMSAVMLVLGVFAGQIVVALGGRIFEGLASDNLLHYVLNAVYSQSKSQKKTSSLIGTSMALYLAGISISPFVAGLFKNFTVSFFIALGIYGIAIIYLQVLVPKPAKQPYGSPVVQASSVPSQERPSTSAIGNFSRIVLTPVSWFKRHPIYVPFGICLFTYNLVQSYMFTSLMVHTSIQFNFTGRENGFLISIAHSVASLYIFVSLYLVPKLSQLWKKRRAASGTDETPENVAPRDALLGLASQLIEVLSFVGLGFAMTAGQIYFLTALLALSLPAPSFIKAAFVSLFEGEEKSKGLAALAAMETLGSVVGPIIIGGWQSYTAAGRTVFFIAAGVAAVSMVCFGMGVVVTGIIGWKPKHMSHTNARSA